jgi:hypothetical protein
MNLSNANARPAPLRALTDSEFRLRNDIKVDPRHPSVSFVWFATTLTGRQSVHQHSVTFYRTTRDESGAVVPTRFYGRTTQEMRDAAVLEKACTLPRLPAGYDWSGPYLVPATMVSSTERQMSPEALSRRSELADRARKLLVDWMPA